MTDDYRTLDVTRATSTGHRLLHYDGACHNVHGHNMVWEARVTVNASDVGDDQMPLDLKDVSAVIDTVDHALLLNEDDPLVEHADALGDVLTFEGDPTCENVVEWMAEKIVSAYDCVEHVSLTVSETEKYAISTDVHADGV